MEIIETPWHKKEQLMCGVLSGFYLLSPLDRIDNLIAKIYVDKNNSKRYVVILSGKKGIFTL